MNRIVDILLLSALVIFFVGSKAMGQDDGDGSNIPPIDRPDILPEDLRDLIQSYREEKHALRSELRTILDQLVDPTRDAIHVAIDAFREDNADRIADQREVALQIRDQLRELRGDRPARPDRDPLPPEIQEQRDDFRAARQDLRTARRQLFNDIKNLTDEERHAAIDDFRELHQQDLQELKDLRREIRDAVRDEVGDDRRADDEG